MKNKNDPPKSVQETENPTSTGRRGTLKTLLTGAGIVATGQALPDRWIKPVVSSIIMPAHAQMSPSSGPAFECQFQEVGIVDNGEGEGEVGEGGEVSYTVFAEAATEAPGATSVDFVLRNPGIELDGGTGDLTFSGSITGGFAFFSDSFTSESTFTEFELDLDLGSDGETDCSSEASVTAPGGP